MHIKSITVEWAEDLDPSFSEGNGSAAMFVVAEARITTPTPHNLIQTIRSGGSCGIDTEETENVRRNCARDELADLRAALSWLGATPDQLTAACAGIELLG